jgi:hypothetical protein
MNNAQYPQMLSRKKLPKAKKGDAARLPDAITLHPKARHILENYVQDYKKKEANLEFRRDMMQKDKSANISRELDRLRGILHNHIVRQDALQGVLNNLNHRLVTLEDLGG